MIFCNNFSFRRGGGGGVSNCFSPLNIYCIFLISDSHISLVILVERVCLNIKTFVLFDRLFCSHN